MSRTLVTGSMTRRDNTWKYSAVTRGLKQFSWASFKSWLPQTERTRDRSDSLTWTRVSSEWSVCSTRLLSLMSFVNNLKLTVMLVHSDLRPKHHLVISLTPSMRARVLKGSSSSSSHHLPASLRSFLRLSAFDELAAGISLDEMLRGAVAGFKSKSLAIAVTTKSFISLATKCGMRYAM